MSGNIFRKSIQYLSKWEPMNPYVDVKTTLIASAIAGIISSYLAYRRGKNPILWFLIGMLFGFFGVFALFFATTSKKQETPTLKAIEPEPYLVGPSNKLWYYLDTSHTQVGPISYNGITSAWKEGKVAPTTFVWHEDLIDWKPLKDLIASKNSQPTNSQPVTNS